MIHNIKSPTELSGFYVIYHGSTLLEGPGLRGASHLLEHLMCKSFEHLQDELQAHCITWNAYTSPNEVVFYMTGLETELQPYRKQLLDALAKFDITQEQFDTEKKIVLQEYDDAFSDPYGVHTDNVLRSRFNYYSPIGLRADLEALTLDQLKAYWAEWFSHPTGIINVSDRYHHMETRKMPAIAVINSALMPKGHPMDPNRGKPTLEILYSNRPDDVVVIQTDPIKSEIPVLKIAASMLGSGLNSPLYQEIREKRGLVYGVWFQAHRYNEEHLFMISAKVTKDKAEEMMDVALEVIGNPAKYLTSERLEMIRKELQLSDRIDAVNRYCNVYPWITPERFQTKMIQDTVTLDEVHAAVEHHFEPSRMFTSIHSKAHL